MPFLVLLFQHKEFLVVVMLLIGILLGGQYIKHLHNVTEELRANNAVLKSNLQASNDSIKTLEASINQQNTAVEKLKSAADARVQSHAVEIAAANTRAEAYRQQSADILKLKPQDADRCKAANDLINSEILKNAKK